MLQNMIVYADCGLLYWIYYTYST